MNMRIPSDLAIASALIAISASVVTLIIAIAQHA
jgi:hypothetical protein